MGDTDKKNDPIDCTMSLGDHLEELRARLILAILGLAIGAVVGRYLYPRLEARMSFTRLERQLIQLDRSSGLPRLRFNENASARDIVGSALVRRLAALEDSQNAQAVLDDVESFASSMLQALNG